MRLLQIIINNIKLPIKHNNDMVITDYTKVIDIINPSIVTIGNYSEDVISNNENNITFDEFLIESSNKVSEYLIEMLNNL